MAMKRKTKRKLLIALWIILGFFALVILVLGVLYLYSKTYSIPKQDATIENTTGLIQAHDKSLYDSNGNKIQLRGVNAGQILVQEGWMSPFSLEPLRNADGSYVKDDGGFIQYPEFTEEDYREGLKSNPNLKDHSLDELMRLYRECFFTEEDFRIIKEDLQMNVIRLPFYYRNIVNDDLSLKSEEDAFGYLDWFMEMAAKYELYVILDLHGVPGSQNGYEHSGSSIGEAGFWKNESYIQCAIDIWDFISTHYTETKPELGKWIASYDLLNEPTYTYGGTTNKKCWDVFDRMYDVIRENGDNHVITMEGCWGFNKLPNPDKYDWENVQYEYHWYNWWSDILPYDVLYATYDAFNIGRDYNVPVLIGEFTLFEDKEEWHKTLELFDDRNYSWTIYNYKTTVTGWWPSSWGIYTCELQVITEWEQTKCNVSTCTYDEYVSFCEKTRTQNCVTSVTYDVIKEYNTKNRAAN